MKKITILFLSLLCAIVCSCQKSPQDLLLGTWQVKRIEYTGSIGGAEAHQTMQMEDQNAYYVFTDGGNGMYQQEDYVQSFSYLFNEETNTLILTYKNSENVLTVETLTKDEFIFHSKALSLGSIGSMNSQVFCTHVKK